MTQWANHRRIAKEETDTVFWVENLFGRDHFRERGVYDFYIRFYISGSTTVKFDCYVDGYIKTNILIQQDAFPEEYMILSCIREMRYSQYIKASKIYLK
jgi:hypothetical protein